MPVLYGIPNSTAGTVNEVVGGLAVPSPIVQFDANFPSTFGKGLCPQAGELVGSTGLRFGYDVSTGCVLSLNRSQLIDMCCTGSTACDASLSSSDTIYGDSTGLPYFLKFDQG